jgi:Raf kinase inhibitor-like YbhB/YbcL family protein
MPVVRRWMAAALVPLLVVGCGTVPAVSPELTQSPADSRPTPAGPTPTLPVARAIASPSPGGSLASGGNGPANAQAALSFVLQSPAFPLGGSLPADFTCDGAGTSPPLTWSGAPPATAAYALLEQDTDVVIAGEPFTQWVLYNMPKRVTKLDAGMPPRLLLTNGSQQGKNSDQSVGYERPCPNKGDPPHHFTFQLYAQDDYVTLETGASVQAVRDALAGHVLARAQLMATFER